MFSKKVVLVTGASGGIGAAVADCFAKEGASLTIVGRNEAKLKDVAQRCEKIGANVLIIKADVSIDDEAKIIVKKTIDKFGKLDVLINNAGVLKFGTILESNMLQIYHEVMNTNLRSVVHITNLAVPHLVETKGNIVNVSSVAAKKVFPSINAYGISKAGMDYFTKCAAMELASSGVRINVVNPGPVTSDMLQVLQASDLMKNAPMADITALGRVSGPEEIADLILYLASDKARGITGACYVLDNGVLL